MSSPTLTRRALIAGAGTAIASAAIAGLYVNAVRAEDVCSLPVELESITDKLDRLTSELSQAMAEYMGGKFKVVVEPGPDGDVTFVRMAGEARLVDAMNEAKAAAEAIDPTIKSWLTKLPSQSGGDWCAVTLTALRA